MANQRIKQRHRKRLSVRFGIDRPSKIGFTDDLTHDGLFLRTAVVAKPGTILQVEIELRDELVALVGEVRWARPVPANLLHKLKGGMGLLITGFLSGEQIYRDFCDELVEQRGKYRKKTL